MSQEFKLQFDEMKQGNPTKAEFGAGSQGKKYFVGHSHVRNLCLVWPDGRMKFYNYAYLVSGEYFPDEGKIVLIFTSVSVIIVGSDLAGLFDDLISHRLQLISYIDSRYFELNGTGSFMITDISVLQIK